MLWHCAYRHNSANLSALPPFAVWDYTLSHRKTGLWLLNATQATRSSGTINQIILSIILYGQRVHVFKRALIWLVIWLGMSDDRNFHYNVIIYRCEIWWYHWVKTTPVIRSLTSCRCLLSRLTRSSRRYWNWRTTISSQEDKYSNYPDAPAAHSQSRRITVATGFNSIHPRLFGSLRRLWDRPSHCLSSPSDQRDASKANEREANNFLESQTASQSPELLHSPNIWVTPYEAPSEVDTKHLSMLILCLWHAIEIQKAISKQWILQRVGGEKGNLTQGNRWAISWKSTIRKLNRELSRSSDQTMVAFTLSIKLKYGSSEMRYRRKDLRSVELEHEDTTSSE